MMKTKIVAEIKQIKHCLWTQNLNTAVNGRTFRCEYAKVLIKI